MTSKFKTGLEIMGGIVAIIIAIFGLIELFHPFRRLPESALEIVDYTVDTEGVTPKMKIKIRNTGGSVAYLKEAEIIIEESKVMKKQVHYATEVRPVLYSWLITSRDIESKRSLYPLSRKIDANDVDNIEFILGFEKTNCKLEARFKLKLYYNKNQSTLTSISNIVIDNAGGIFPKVILPEDDAELLMNLQVAKANYTIRQIIEELTKRKYEPAILKVLKYFQNSDPNVRIAVAKYFCEVKSEKAIADLITNLLNDNNPQVRKLLFNALIFHGEEAVDKIGNLITDNDPAVRELVATLLGEIKSTRSEKFLIKAIEDRGIAKTIFGEQVLVAASAIRSLSKLHSTEIIPKIIELLHDKNLSVKLAAIEATSTLKITFTIPELIEMLDSTESRIQKNAHKALVKIVGNDYGVSSKIWKEKLNKKCIPDRTESLF